MRTRGRSAENSSPRYSRWLRTPSTTVRSRGIVRVTRSMVCWSNEREPRSRAYCFGRWSPDTYRGGGPSRGGGRDRSRGRRAGGSPRPGRARRAPATELQPYQPVGHGVAGQLGGGPEAQLLHDAGLVELHGLHGDVEDRRDFL